MIDTVIVSGGMIRKDFALDFLKKLQNENGEKKLRFIAADRGLDFFRETGLAPDIVDGDFDSVSEEGKAYLDSLTEAEIIKLQPEKDDTDTQSAVNLAIQKGARNILILGATGGRLDHFLGNLGILTLGKQKNVQVALVDEQNYLCLAESGTRLFREKQFGKYVSFFPVGGEVKGLTLEGFKYALNGYDLTVADCGLTVSNEIQDEEARISYKKGSLLMIMSRDRR